MSNSNSKTDADQESPKKARYIMIGGFLGAGKTTAVARLAKRLADRGTRVGLITNDQGSELVDTAMLRSRGFSTEEIPGGCFCCRFNSLLEAADRLSSSTAPEVFIAEPVGSCTDLVATVTYPLRRMYGDQFEIAPLSVLVDPIRASRVLGLQDGGKFSPKVTYIYRKQLEEAQIIVVNKCDLLDSEHIARLRDSLRSNFPKAEICEISARNETGLEAWFDRIEKADLASGEAMEIDYEVYADGEARLGWLNCTVTVSSRELFDGNRLLERLTGEIQRRVATEGGEIAHLKMTLSSPEALLGLAAINLVRNDLIPELSEILEDLVCTAQIIVNLRAEASPDTLKTAVESGLKACEAEIPRISLRVEHLEHFRPGKPVPTHRIAALT
ncbi:MAG: cobalamin biosynthesis protein P47K [Verrucomicrobia bacterium]|nr:cobalamin biosynthesis protein P47K [Verrucomicrobiota bacterium]